MKRSVRRFLRRRGASDAEIDNAARSGYLTLLVLDREIMPGKHKYTMAELAKRAGTDLDTARRIWRAVGFPDMPNDLHAFSDHDIDAMRSFLERTEQTMVTEWTLERLLAQARVLSASLARVADNESDDIARSFKLAHDAGMSDEDLAAVLADRVRFDDVARLIDHVHRLQLRAAIWRKLAASELRVFGTVTAAVGFVDLVGYTAMSKELDEEELIALVERFGARTHDAVVSSGGRIVKMIGDEIMFITDTPGTAATIGLRLVEVSRRDDLLPQVRAGLAFGEMVSREGDYYGPVVNLASRLTEMARPGSVLVSAELAAALSGDGTFHCRRIPGRRVRDIGRVDVYRLSAGSVRPATEAPG